LRAENVGKALVQPETRGNHAVPVICIEGSAGRKCEGVLAGCGLVQKGTRVARDECVRQIAEVQRNWLIGPVRYFPEHSGSLPVPRVEAESVEMDVLRVEQGI